MIVQPDYLIVRPNLGTAGNSWLRDTPVRQSCPLNSRKQTSIERSGTSAKCEKRTFHPRALGEHPSTITDDLVARASGITGVAQRQSSSFQVAAFRFDKEASNRQVATRLLRAQTGPVTIFYGRSGRRIQVPGGLISVIVRQVGADDEQCVWAAP